MIYKFIFMTIALGEISLIGSYESIKKRLLVLKPQVEYFKNEPAQTVFNEEIVKFQHQYYRLFGEYLSSNLLNDMEIDRLFDNISKLFSEVIENHKLDLNEINFLCSEIDQGKLDLNKINFLCPKSNNLDID